MDSVSKSKYSIDSLIDFTCGIRVKDSKQDAITKKALLILGLMMYFDQSNADNYNKSLMFFEEKSNENHKLIKEYVENISEITKYLKSGEILESEALDYIKKFEKQIDEKESNEIVNVFINTFPYLKNTPPKIDMVESYARHAIIDRFMAIEDWYARTNMHLRSYTFDDIITFERGELSVCIKDRAAFNAESGGLKISFDRGSHLVYLNEKELFTEGSLCLVLNQLDAYLVINLLDALSNVINKENPENIEALRHVWQIVKESILS